MCLSVKHSARGDLNDFDVRYEVERHILNPCFEKYKMFNIFNTCIQY